MSDDPQTSSLQFDRAEFTTQPGPLTCRGCERTISSSYFEINGMTTCPECREQVEQSVAVGMGTIGVLRAVTAGVGAGIVGALIYYAVAALSGYEFGLIAIVVGYLVGRAVRWGSGNRGGRGYQVLAVATTYVAIVSTYVPFIVQGIRESASRNANATISGPRTPATVAENPRSAPDPSAKRINPVVVLAVFAAFVLASPFLAGFQNILGWVIIAIALFEAWKINRRVHLAITGPFTVPPATPQPVP